MFAKQPWRSLEWLPSAMFVDVDLDSDMFL